MTEVATRSMPHNSPTDVMTMLNTTSSNRDRGGSTSRSNNKDYDSASLASLASSISLQNLDDDDDDSSTASFSSSSLYEDSFCCDDGRRVYNNNDKETDDNDSSVLISDAEEEDDEEEDFDDDDDDDDDILHHQVIQVVVEGYLDDGTAVLDPSSPSKSKKKADDGQGADDFNLQDYKSKSFGSASISSCSLSTSSSSQQQDQENSKRRGGKNNSEPRRFVKRGVSASKAALLNQAAEVNESLTRRENSRLNRLSNSSSNLSSSSRSGGHSRRRAMKRQSQEQDDVSNPLDGSMSFSQLQVGDMVLLSNKELDTSSHLKRRMPSRSRPTSTSVPQKSISEPASTRRGTGGTDTAPLTPSRRSCPKRTLSASISSLGSGRPVLSRENSKLNQLSMSNHGPPSAPRTPTRRSAPQRTGSFGGSHRSAPPQRTGSFGGSISQRRGMKKTDAILTSPESSCGSITTSGNNSGRPVLSRENSKLNQLSMLHTSPVKGSTTTTPGGAGSGGGGGRCSSGAGRRRHRHRDMMNNESQSLSSDNHTMDDSNRSFSSSVGSDLGLLANKELDTSSHLKRSKPSRPGGIKNKRWST